MKPIPATKLKPLIKYSSGQQVKSKFFNMIGIETVPSSSRRQNLSSIGCPITHHHIDKNGLDIHPRSVGIVGFQEQLKYDRMDEDLLLYQRRKIKQDHDAKSKNKKKITFNDSVNVLPIPKRHEYSKRVSSRIWSNSEEIQRLIPRCIHSEPFC